MKYCAPVVLNTINATEFIRGGKGTKNSDSSLQPSDGAGYPADE